MATMMHNTLVNTGLNCLVVGCNTKNRGKTVKAIIKAMLPSASLGFCSSKVARPAQISRMAMATHWITLRIVLTRLCFSKYLVFSRPRLIVRIAADTVL